MLQHDPIHSIALVSVAHAGAGRHHVFVVCHANGSLSIVQPETGGVLKSFGPPDWQVTCVAGASAVKAIGGCETARLDPSLVWIGFRADHESLACFRLCAVPLAAEDFSEGANGELLEALGYDLNFQRVTGVNQPTPNSSSLFRSATTVTRACGAMVDTPGSLRSGVDLVSGGSVLIAALCSSVSSSHPFLRLWGFSAAKRDEDEVSSPQAKEGRHYRPTLSSWLVADTQGEQQGHGAAIRKRVGPRRSVKQHVSFTSSSSDSDVAHSDDDEHTVANIVTCFSIAEARKTRQDPLLPGELWQNVLICGGTRREGEVLCFALTPNVLTTPPPVGVPIPPHEGGAAPPTHRLTASTVMLPCHGAVTSIEAVPLSEAGRGGLMCFGCSSGEVVVWESTSRCVVAQFSSRNCAFPISAVAWVPKLPHALHPSDDVVSVWYLWAIAGGQTLVILKLTCPSDVDHRTGLPSSSLELHATLSLREDISHGCVVNCIMYAPAVHMIAGGASGADLLCWYPADVHQSDDAGDVVLSPSPSPSPPSVPPAPVPRFDAPTENVEPQPLLSASPPSSTVQPEVVAQSRGAESTEVISEDVEERQWSPNQVVTSADETSSQRINGTFPLLHQWEAERRELETQLEEQFIILQAARAEATQWRDRCWTLQQELSDLQVQHEHHVTRTAAETASVSATTARSLKLLTAVTAELKKTRKHQQLTTPKKLLTDTAAQTLTPQQADGHTEVERLSRRVQFLEEIVSRQREMVHAASSSPPTKKVDSAGDSIARSPRDDVLTRCYLVMRGCLGPHMASNFLRDVLNETATSPLRNGVPATSNDSPDVVITLFQKLCERVGFLQEEMAAGDTALTLHYPSGVRRAGYEAFRQPPHPLLNWN